MVVADDEGRVECVFELLIGGGLEIRGAVVIGQGRDIAEPRPGIAVCLELGAHTVAVLTGAVVRVLGHHAGDVLDVVAPFVSDDVELGELPRGGAELLAHEVEERRIDVDALVGGAVEGSDRVRCGAAGRRGLPVDDRQRGFDISVDVLRPVVVEDDLGTGHAAVDGFVGILAGVAFVEAAPLRAVRTLIAFQSPAAEQPADIDAEERTDEQHQNETADADSTAGDRGVPTPSTGLVAADVGVPVEGHGIKIPRSPLCDRGSRRTRVRIMA